MSSDKLRQARSLEAEAILQIPEAHRPAFHVTGGVGWINDPNGFSCCRGEYHLFFQYHPYSNQWGPMHWGHVKTKDFIRWQRLPVALAPDQEYDFHGCFSGSAVQTPDGKHLLMYTGVHKIPGENGVPAERQIQCIAIGDGVEYRKVPENPVLTAFDVPEGHSAVDFRDPKLWYDPEENRYYSVIGSRAPDDSGAVLLYSSPDGIHWEYVCILDACRREYGRMWECPDFFPLDGAHVLLVNPQDMQPMGLEFHPGNGSLCILGDYEKKTHRFTRRHVHSLDYGLDFYAPQTLLTPDGRRILIGWMQNWAACHAQPENFRWFGQMTLPRELSIRDGRLIQNPVRELENYRSNPVVHRNVPLSRETTLPGVQGRILDMTVTVRPGDKTGYRCFTMTLAQGGEYYSTVRFDPAAGTVCMDRTFSGFPHDIVHSRTFPVEPGQKLKLRVILDRFSAELFIRDGRQCASMTLYTPRDCDGICFSAEGNAFLDVEKYDLRIPKE